MDNEDNIEKQPQMNNIDNAILYKNECNERDNDKIKQILFSNNSSTSFGQIKKKTTKAKQRTSILDF